MPWVMEPKPSASASRACSSCSWKRACMSSPCGNWARSIRPNCIMRGPAPAASPTDAGPTLARTRGRASRSAPEERDEDGEDGEKRLQREIRDAAHHPYDKRVVHICFEPG